MIYDAAEVIVLVCWKQIKRKFPQSEDKEIENRK
jgi:hypothetical protein